MEGPEKYLIVCTGHQGEPKAVLSKIIKKYYEFHLRENDIVIFSCKTIPVETNIKQRAILEEALQDLAITVFKDVHVSGHAAQEDIKELLNLVKPEHLIPFHGIPSMSKALKSIGIEKGYDDFEYLLNDHDLDQLKEDPRFKEYLLKVKK